MWQSNNFVRLFANFSPFSASQANLFQFSYLFDQKQKRKRNGKYEATALFAIILSMEFSRARKVLSLTSKDSSLFHTADTILILLQFNRKTIFDGKERLNDSIYTLLFSRK